MYVILNKDINFPTLLLPLKVVYNERSNIYLGLIHYLFPHRKIYIHIKGVFALLKEVPNDDHACVVVECHRAKYLKKHFTRFMLLHESEY